LSWRYGEMVILGRFGPVPESSVDEYHEHLGIGP
jgi:hypothetical protein